MNSQEPLAIVGIGCHFPGDADDPMAFWRLIMDRGDAITEIPPDRWRIETHYDPRPGMPGKSISKWGGFLRDIAAFDADFFRISAREAPCLDPQQRLLLQTAYEALEDAGETLASLQGSSTGVFIGISTSDYATLQVSPTASGRVEAWTATGNLVSIAANRISYCFDLLGPSLAVDTACSSSLVALHLACESLARAECNLAVVGGVNALILPTPFITFSAANMLSPDGRCKAFAADANGYVRAEGVGVVVIKPLATAVAAGDTIYAEIRGTACNEDGRNTGLTIPNPLAQAALIRTACQRAGVDPQAIHYVEAHGTGTATGDPAEAEALGAALGMARPANRPLLIGSVKTNIGHLEAAAGIAGLIKTALALRHGILPPNLHFSAPNPHIDFQHLRLQVVTEPTPLPATEPVFAGINSFGAGGANAHAILATASRPAARHAPERPAELLLLSARSPAVLRNQAQRYAEALTDIDDGIALADIAGTAATARSHYTHRLAVLAEDRPTLHRRLTDYAAEGRAVATWEGLADHASAPVFVFSGQGSQQPLMALELYASESSFRTAVDRCRAVYRRLGGWDLLTEIQRDEANSRLRQTAFAQPAVYAVQMGLVALLDAWGVRPRAVLGHSVGEVAAAAAAGVLSLEEGARVVLERGRCMENPPGEGRMLSVSLDFRQVLDVLRGVEDRIALSAINSPRTVVLSGDRQPLETLARQLERGGVSCRWLPVNYSFHSHHLEPARIPMLAALAGLRPAPARVPIVSTVHGGPAGDGDFSTDYWWANVRQPVFFASAVMRLIGEGCRHFIEIGPQAVLARPLLECLSSAGVRDGQVLATLRRDGPDRAALLETVGRLHIRGGAVDWSAVFGPIRRVRLPVGGWNTVNYWREDASWRAARLEPPGHPLLGRRAPGPAAVWQVELSPGRADYLLDHRVRGQAMMPAAAYIEMALAAGGETGAVAIGMVDFRKGLIHGGAERPIQLSLALRGADFEILSASDGGQQWTVHAAGRLLPPESPPPPMDLDALQRRLPPGPPPTLIYPQLAAAGLNFGPAFQGLQRVWRKDGEALGELLLPENLGPEGYGIHPALLDACLQVLTLTLPEDTQGLYLPTELLSGHLYRRAGNRLYCWAELVRSGTRLVEGRLLITDSGGAAVMQLTGLISRAAGASDRRPVNYSLYRWGWLAGNANERPISPHERLLAPPLAENPEETAVASERLAIDYAAELLRQTETAATAETLVRLLQPIRANLPSGSAAIDVDAASRQFLANHPLGWPQLALLTAARERWHAALGGAAWADPPWSAAREALALRTAPEDTYRDQALEGVLHRLPVKRTLRVLIVGADRALASARAILYLAPGPVRFTLADRLAEAAAAIASQLPDTRHAAWSADEALPGGVPKDSEFDLILNLDPDADCGLLEARAANWLVDGGSLLWEKRATGGVFAAYVTPQWATIEWSPSVTEFTVPEKLADVQGYRLLAATRRPRATVVPDSESLPEGAWLVLGTDPLAAALGGVRSSDGSPPTLRPWPVLPIAEAADIDALVTDHIQPPPRQAGWRGVVLLTQELFVGTDSQPVTAPSMLSAGILRLAAVLRSLIRISPLPPLWVVTQSAQWPSATPKDLTQASFWGFLRVVRNEYPRLGCRIIDLDANMVLEDQLRRLLNELAQADGEDEIAYRAGQRLRPRLYPFYPQPSPAPIAGHWELADPGDERLLVRKPLNRIPLADNEVEIEVRAAGLNFRDVMKALGIYPGREEADYLIGDECAGNILAVGAAVRGWQPGDAVMAITQGCFADRVRARVDAIAQLPAQLDFAAAATLPVAYLTAWYGLKVLGRLQPGETALIHSAAGGVGFAALEVARYLGVRVIATAGNAEKRTFLRALGYTEVLDSRDLGFADSVRRLTAGRGVDLVLNALAGEAIARGIACLAPHGRFIEIGKRDIYANAALGLGAFRESTAFLAFDLGAVLRDRPTECREWLQSIGDLIATGQLRPLPHRLLAMSELPRAVREMGQGRHIGKLVLVNPEPTPLPAANPNGLRADAAYLVTGGTRGFGLAVADWLVRKGVRHLCLIGRGHDATPELAELQQGWATQDVSVRVARLDVADQGAVQALVAELTTQRPLAGVFHAAAVIEDATLATLTPESITRVLAAKASGAWNLHLATVGLSLDHFVLFSSIALTFGNPGQSAYAAANAFLAGLAESRRAQGLVGLCIDWGVIAGVGHAAGREGLAETLEAAGFSGLGVEEAGQILDSLLDRVPAQVVAAKIDWERAATAIPGIAAAPRYSPWITPGNLAALGAKSVRAMLADLPAEQRVAAVREELDRLIAMVLRTTTDRLPADQPLHEIGFDSLMAIELINQVERRFDLALPAAAISSSLSIASIATGILEGLAAATSAEDAPPAMPDQPGAPLTTPQERPPLDLASAWFDPSPANTERLQPRHRLEAGALGALIGLFRGKTHAQAWRLLGRLLPAFRPMLRKERLWARWNLATVFGEHLTPGQQEIVSRLALRHHLMSYVEGLCVEGIRERVENEAAFFDAHDDGRGVILCGIHLGSWEPLLRWAPRFGFPLSAVYRRAQNPASDQIFQRLRSAYGIRWIPSDDHAQMIETLKAGHVLGMMTDLNTFSGAIFADFLGIPAACPSGPAALALHTGAPLLPAVAVREADGGVRAVFNTVIRPADSLTSATVAALTESINNAFEPWILNYAEQYNWFHPRWRRRPDDALWTPDTPAATLAAARVRPPALPGERLQQLLAAVAGHG